MANDPPPAGPTSEDPTPQSGMGPAHQQPTAHPPGRPHPQLVPPHPDWGLGWPANHPRPLPMLAPLPIGPLHPDRGWGQPSPIGPNQDPTHVPGL